MNKFYLNKYGICCVSIILLLTTGACQQKETLPFLGRRTVSEQGDTLYHTIGNYKLVNQDSIEVTPGTFEGKIYVADFFFTSCPTICPTMKTQMLRIYQRFLNNSDFAILSHSFDTKHDTVAVLKDYAEGLGIENNGQWHFVTGEQAEIFRLGKTDYMITTGTDSDAPGGFIHSGAFILVDQQKRIRGIYDGTIPEDVDVLMADIDILLGE